VLYKIFIILRTTCLGTNKNKYYFLNKINNYVDTYRRSMRLAYRSLDYS
jgi:hypothetical protein